jgi:hypothetical protein
VILVLAATLSGAGYLTVEAPSPVSESARGLTSAACTPAANLTARCGKGRRTTGNKKTRMNA